MPLRGCYVLPLSPKEKAPTDVGGRVNGCVSDPCCPCADPCSISLLGRVMFLRKTNRLALAWDLSDQPCWRAWIDPLGPPWLLT